MERGGSTSIHKGSPIIPILSRINPIPLIDTYLFKVHHNNVLPSTPRLPKGLLPVSLPDKIFKGRLPSSILATCPTHLIYFWSYMKCLHFYLPFWIAWKFSLFRCPYVWTVSIYLIYLFLSFVLLWFFSCFSLLPY